MEGSDRWVRGRSQVERSHRYRRRVFAGGGEQSLVEGSNRRRRGVIAVEGAVSDGGERS